MDGKRVDKLCPSIADPQVISLDIETYGACLFNSNGEPLNPQTVFNPYRSMYTDKVKLEDTILTTSITIPKEESCRKTNNNNTMSCKSTKTSSMMPKTCDEREQSTQQNSQSSPSSSKESSASEWISVQTLQPSETMVFQMDQMQERERLRKWISHSKVILGMNLQFDLQYLRADPYFRFVLDGSHLLIDLSVLNYLHDETRPEKSLKALGPVLRTHTYEETLKHTRFRDPQDPKLKRYNAQDTHNTMLAIRELSRRICKDFPNSPKLEPWCLQFYSDTIWTCIRMSEAGIPMNRKRLEGLEQKLIGKITRSHQVCSERYGLPLEGPGSGKAKTEFIELLCDIIDGDKECNTYQQCKKLMTSSEESEESSLQLSSSDSSSVSLMCGNGTSVRDNPLLTITPKQKIISFSEENRNLLTDLLPGGHILRKALKHSKRHAASQKLLSSYCYPLLRHRRNHPHDRSSILIPRSHGEIEIAYPTWYCVPTYAKDSGGAQGGTLQGRITCKKPSAQTFPKEIKRCMQSRFRGGAILGFDLSQVELRVAALLSGDTALMAAYSEGADLHKQRALQIFGPDIEGDPKFHDFRQAGKMINFADLFRSGPATMQTQLLAMTGQKHPLEFFKNVADSRAAHRPGLWAWQERRIKEARTNGYVCLPFTGQSRYFMGGDKWDVNEIVNFPVQTTAGNTLLRIQSHLHKNMEPLNSRKPQAYMFLNIYDALYVDCKEEYIPTIKELVAQAIHYVEHEGYWARLQDKYGRSIPLEYDCEVVA